MCKAKVQREENLRMPFCESVDGMSLLEFSALWVSMDFPLQFEIRCFFEPLCLAQDGIYVQHLKTPTTPPTK
jgi:hypothetical protein